MAVTKIIELVGSSTTSSDEAVKAALAEAQGRVGGGEPEPAGQLGLF